MNEWVGWLATICFSICYIPQIIRTHRLKTVDDLSIWVWWLNLVGCICAFIYGLILELIPLIYGELVATSLVAIIIIQWAMYRDSARAQAKRLVKEVLEAMRKNI